MILDRFWQLLAKKLAGEATGDEIRELENIIKTNPDLSFSGQNVADIWQLKPQENKTETENAFAELTAKLNLENEETPDEFAEADHGFQKRQPKKWIGVFSLAAIVGMTLSYFALFKKVNGDTQTAKSQKQEVTTRPGSRTRLDLPDGSIVWLNAGSKITYSQPFGENERTVGLTGEAYFDVVKKDIPFIIHTNGASIRVLGTTFNVRSYPSEKKIETSLVKGRVEVILDKNPDNKYVLKPSQKLVLATEETKLKKGNREKENPIAVLSNIHYIDSSTIAETSWVENKLVFDDESFEEIARKMERWYGVTIRFKADKLKTERLTGIFEKETIYQALGALRESTPFNFTIKSNEIIITH